MRSISWSRVPIHRVKTISSLFLSLMFSLWDAYSSFCSLLWRKATVIQTSYYLRFAGMMRRRRLLLLSSGYDFSCLSFINWGHATLGSSVSYWSITVHTPSLPYKPYGKRVNWWQLVPRCYNTVQGMCESWRNTDCRFATQYFHCFRTWARKRFY